MQGYVWYLKLFQFIQKEKKKHQKQTKNHPNLSRFLTDNIHSTCWFSGFCLFVCFKENQ